MIRTALAPRPVRAGAAVAAVAGVVLLAGCAPSAADEAVESPTGTGSADTGSSDTGSADAGDTASGSYADGEYTAEGSYATPESVETISVTVTLEDDVVTSVEVVGEPQRAESQRYQSQFIGGVADVVVGEPIDEIRVSRVAGSSLTGAGFNAAIDEIRSLAAA